MTVLRINFHIRRDVSPRLFDALATMSPRPRAELLRRLAELGLRVERESQSPGSAKFSQANTHLSSSIEAAGEASFGDDLAGAVGEL